MALERSAVEAVVNRIAKSDLDGHEYELASNRTKLADLNRKAADYAEMIEVAQAKRSAILGVQINLCDQMFAGMQRLAELTEVKQLALGDNKLAVEIESDFGKGNIRIFLPTGVIEVTGADGVSAVKGTIRNKLVHTNVIVPITQMLEKGAYDDAVKLVIKHLNLAAKETQ